MNVTMTIEHEGETYNSRVHLDGLDASQATDQVRMLAMSVMKKVFELKKVPIERQQPTLADPGSIETAPGTKLPDGVESSSSMK